MMQIGLDLGSSPPTPHKWGVGGLMQIRLSLSLTPTSYSACGRLSFLPCTAGLYIAIHHTDFRPFHNSLVITNSDYD